MSRTNRNFVIAYVLLVALPIVGLLAVLKSGRSLTAPISVDGIWQLRADPTRLSSLPCGKALAANPEMSLAISQSGRNFTLTLANGPKSIASGVLEGTALKATLVPANGWSDEAGCGAGRQLNLVAAVDTSLEPRSLSGLLSVSDCPSCGSVEFHAVRLALAAKKGLH
jgi:hypothetical protein